MKSHLSLILWSNRSTALCSLLMFGTVLVNLGDRKATSPAVKSLPAGIRAHSAAMAGLRPFMRGSRVPLSAGSIAPIRGSLSQCVGSELQETGVAATSRVAVGLRL